MDQTLIGNFIRFPTTKLVWDAIDTTYFDGNDTSQVYELRRRVTRLQQGNGSLEKFYTELQGLWWEIDFRHPNPMERATDIYHYNKLLQEDHVYTFLDGLDDRLDNIRSDVLQMRPFPSIEQAYAHVRREALRQAVESSQDAGPVFDCGSNLVTSSYDVDRVAWLLDFGATDHMTFVATDFTTTSPSRRTSVVNANGVVSPITRDILTKEIIGRDTKRGDLYYMEDVSTDPPLENILEVSILDTSSNISDLNTSAGYTLPFRENRGKPPTRYSPDIEKRKSKYPIANYVSTRRLSKPLKAFVHVLSSSQIPARVQEALSNPKWTQVIKEEMEALLKNNTWTIVPLRMLECKPVDTPIVQNHRLGEYLDQAPMDTGRYQRLVGKLIYFSHTRPDIAYVVSVVSQFMHNPSEDHMDAVIRILRYLKSSPGKGLMFSKNGHLRINGYTDADWARNISDRRYTLGYFMFVGGNLVTWRSKKQKVVALSSTEAKFRGMAKGVCELLWIKRLLTELGFASASEMDLFCDNKAAIANISRPSPT
ncbi:Retrovirus-related Pol polyprotein from transposon RE1 [Vitis vinifera]|uniref:Retrovirus-related Pol polyprotein from transposon RE1 n=1 Tax=Vitis vinifera TaxID=29760 RepID=A0A438G0R8_VITVI|nr:Retrovirus-related Pol polyprotein from transposon RE1 [Vitis vinifera]